jgi:hypothetical protein
MPRRASALILIALFAAGPVAAKTIVFWEDTHTYSGDGVDNRENWNPVPEAPCDWVSPVNYRDGRVYVEVQVISMSQSAEGYWHFFMFSPGSDGCQGRDASLTHKGVSRRTIRFTGPGTYRGSCDVSSMNSYAKEGSSPLAWDWTNAVSRAGRNFANTEETPASAFPMTMEITVWLVSAGSVFEGTTGVLDQEFAPAPQRHTPHQLRIVRPGSPSGRLEVLDVSGRQVLRSVGAPGVYLVRLLGAGAEATPHALFPNH